MLARCPLSIQFIYIKSICPTDYKQIIFFPTGHSYNLFAVGNSKDFKTHIVRPSKST